MCDQTSVVTGKTQAIALMPSELRVDAPTRWLLKEAEAKVRLKMDRCKFGPEQLRILDYAIARSFWEGRISFYFVSWRALGKATDNGNHAQELMYGSSRKPRGLVELGIFAPLELADRRWHWYRWNLNFLQWPAERERPQAFWEQPPLPFEPGFMDLVQQATAEEWQRFAEEFSAGFVPNEASRTTRERDAVSAQLSGADINAGETKSPPRSTQGEPTRGNEVSQEKLASAREDARPPDREVTTDDWDKFKKSFDAGTVERDFPASTGVPYQGTGVPSIEGTKSPGVPSAQGTESVPYQGTKVYPEFGCTPPGYSGNTNKDAAKARAVPSQGTSPYIASSIALSTKAKLAILFKAVPLQGTETWNEKVALALDWLQRVDTSEGWRVDRFRQQFIQLAHKHPDYVLNVCPNILLRQVELRGQVNQSLALLAKAARADKKMEKWQ